MNPLARAILDALEPRQYLTALYWEGGSGDWSDTNWNTVYDFSGSTVGWTNGSSATFRDDSITITVSSGITASTIDTGANQINFTDGGSGSLTITSGVEFQSCTFDVPVTTNGAVSFISNTFGTETNNGNATIYGSYLSATHLINNGTLTWENPQDITISNTVIDNYGSIEFDGGDEYTLTLNNSTIDNHNDSEILWTSGHIFFTNASSLTNDDEGIVTFDGGIVDLDYDATFTNNATMNWMDGTITLYTPGSFVNTGNIKWLGEEPNEIANITNDGGIISFTLTSELIDLSESDTTGIEGSEFTLVVGDTSELISDTITGYYVDWGDDAGWNFYDEPGEVTYTYGGSITASTNYTITVHLIGENGTFIAAATTTAIIDNAIQAPTNVTATSDDENGIDIEWEDASAIADERYDIEVKYHGSENWYLLTSRPAFSTSYHWDNWALDDMDFRVTAVGTSDSELGAGESACSEASELEGNDSFLNTGDAQNLDIDVSAGNAYMNGMTVSWDHQDDHAGDYFLLFRIPSDSPVDSAWHDPIYIDTFFQFDPATDGHIANSAIPIDGLLLTWPGNIDFIMVGGDSDIPSNIITRELTGSLTAPVITSCTLEEDDTYTLTWNAVSSATGYEAFSTAGMDPVSSHPVPFNSISTSNGVVTANVTCDPTIAIFTIVATNSTSNSAMSAPFDFRTPPTPTDLHAVIVYSSTTGHQTVRVSFKGSVLATGYKIKYYTDDPDDPTVIDVGNSSSNDLDLAGGVTYTFSVAAYRNTNTNISDYSGTVPVDAPSNKDIGWAVIDDPVNVTRGTGGAAGAATTVDVTAINLGSNAPISGKLNAHLVLANGNPDNVTTGISITRTFNKDGHAKFDVTATGAVPLTAPGTKYYLKFVDEGDPQANYTIVELVIK